MANERLTLQIDTVTTGQAQVEALAASLNKVTSIAEAAQSKLSAAPNPAGYENFAKRVGDSFGHGVVPQVAAASAAVRAFEGTLSVRAVERFLTSVLQIGPALQAAFPVIGALAFADVLVKLGEKAVDLYKKIDPVAQAQQRMVDTTKALAGEIQNLGKEINNLDLDRFEKVFGAGTRQQFEANQITQRDVQRDQNEIAALRGMIAQRQGVVNRGRINNIWGNRLTPEAQAAQQDIDTFNTQLSESLLRLQRDQGRANSLVESAAQGRADELQKQRDDASRDAEARQRQVSQYGRRGSLASMSPVERIYAEMQELFPGASAAQRGTLMDSANQQAAAELARQESAQKPLAPYVSTEMSKDIADGLQRFDKDVLQYLTSLNGQTRSRTNNQISGIRTYAEHQARLSGIANGNSPEEAQRELDIRNQALDTERKIVEAHSELYDMDVERFRLEKESQDNQFAFEERIAEHRKQQLQDAQQSESAFSNFVVSGFNALTTRGGTRGFVTGIGRNLADTVVGNAAGMLFNSHSMQSVLGSLHTGGFLGNLLKGTPFGAGGNNPVLSANTSATAANTAATQSLTSALHSLRTGAMSPSGGGGGFFSGFGGSGLGTDAFGNTIPDIGAGSDGGIMSTNAIPDSWTQLPGIGNSTGGGSGFGFNASTIGKAAGAGIGALMAYQGFKKGGASGALQGTSAIMGTAALFDPEPISKAVLAIGAAVTGLVSGFLNGPQQRANQINTELSQNQYLSPTPLNLTQTPGGMYADFDARGNLRTSSMSAYPTVAQPYITSRRLNWGDPRTYYTAPGYVQAPYSGGPAGSGQSPVGNGGVTININALDQQSFADAAMRHRGSLGAAVTAHVQSNGGEALASMLRFHMGM